MCVHGPPAPREPGEAQAGARRPGRRGPHPRPEDRLRRPRHRPRGRAGGAKIKIKEAISNRLRREPAGLGREVRPAKSEGCGLGGRGLGARGVGEESSLGGNGAPSPGAWLGGGDSDLC